MNDTELMPETDKIIRAFWYSANNFGDCINYLLLNHLSGKQVVLCNERDLPHYIVCGSILAEAKRNSIVWGAGFGWSDQNSRSVHKKATILATRGELSAKNMNREVSVIGDPALLLPLIIKREKNVKHHIGIIPHWSNVEDTVFRYPNHFIINPMQSPISFIDKILSCENIFSESLHGLIVADAYGVNNTWIDLDGDTGDGFKYRDYYSSTETPDVTPLKEIEINACQVHDYKHNIKYFLNTCPFLNKKIWT